MTISKLNSDLAWAIVAYFILENKKFRSVTGIQYQARFLNDTIFY